MKKTIFAIILIIFFLDCSTHMVTPPKIDLTKFKSVGVVTFKVVNARGLLDEMATEILLGQLREYNRGSELIKHCKPDETLNMSNKNEITPEQISEFCKKHQLDSVFLGTITVSDFRPNIRIKSLMQRSRINMNFRMTVELKLYSANSGMSLWEGSSFQEGNATYEHFTKNLNPDFYVSDMDESYKEFIRKLIYLLTIDLRPKN